MRKWYRNQKARHDAKKAGLERPRTGGLGDKMSDKLEAGRARSEERANHFRELREQGVESAGDLYRRRKEQKKN